jgi:hypothetical protein
VKIHANNITIDKFKSDVNYLFEDAEKINTGMSENNI